MSTKSKAYTEQISDAQVMKVGLTAHLGELQQRGITPQFINALNESIVKTIEQNNVQERLKADLKAATAALETLLKDLDTAMSEAVKVVKLQMPQPQWKEFGIKITFDLAIQTAGALKDFNPVMSAFLEPDKHTDEIMFTSELSNSLLIILIFILKIMFSLKLIINRILLYMVICH